MATPERRPIGIKIDKITNSIENVVTGESFDTEIVRLTVDDVGQIKKTNWLFDWKREILSLEREVYKLVTVNNPQAIHGLISIEDRDDHFFMHLIESSKFNKGSRKIYFGVPANLVAFTCKRAFEMGYSGFVAFESKTKLVGHYQETLGARIFRNNRMVIHYEEALILVNRYFKKFEL